MIFKIQLNILYLFLVVYSMTLFNIKSYASDSFQYGQCLTNDDAFYKDQTEYLHSLKVISSIKDFSLSNDTKLLRWNYTSIKFIYYLNISKVFFQHVKMIYEDEADSKIKDKFFSFFSGVNGVEIIKQLQFEDLTNETTLEFLTNPPLLSDLKDYLKEISDSHQNNTLKGTYNRILDYLNSPLYTLALSEFFYFVKSSALKSNSKQTISKNTDNFELFSESDVEQWIALSDALYKYSINLDPIQSTKGTSNFYDLKSFFEAVYNKSKINNTIIEGVFIDEESYLDDPKWRNSLPPLLRIHFPTLPPYFHEAIRILNDLYRDSLEDYFFTLNGITATEVNAWLDFYEKNKTNKKSYFNSLKTSFKSVVSNSTSNKLVKGVKKTSSSEKADLLYEYLQRQVKAYGNTFDHYIWNRSKGTPIEKAIDGVARTIYAEAESCQKLNTQAQDGSGVFQFEAIGLTIAHRAISIKKAYNLIGIPDISYNAQESGIAESQYQSTIPIANDYLDAISDFGRLKEFPHHPLISDMPIPAQVVSKPIQFSMWKTTKTVNANFSDWIFLSEPKLSSSKIPFNFSFLLPGGVRSNLDTNQIKALCPPREEEKELFNKALELASEIVTNPYDYVKKYQLFNDKKSLNPLTPYFFSHGRNTKIKAKNVFFNNPSLGIRLNAEIDSDLNNNKYRWLPLKNGNSTESCKYFKLYGAHKNSLYKQKFKKK